MSLIIENVSKQFRDVRAVDDLSMTIRQGTVFGFLGPNGAGKTTTLRMVLGIILPDSGRVTWKGKPFGRESTGMFGYLPEERGLYPKMRVEEHLIFLGRINGLGKQDAQKRAAEWIERFELGDYRNKKVEELSKGNQQKVQTIGTMMHKPEILFLDEPFSGLDPVNSALLRDALLEGNRQGQTIVFSSHRMDQVEELCQDICIINKGKLLLSGGLREIKKSMGRQTLRLSVEGKEDFWKALPGLTFLNQRADYVELRISPEVNPGDVLKAAMEAGNVIRFELAEPSLDEIFVSKVGDVA